MNLQQILLNWQLRHSILSLQRCHDSWWYRVQNRLAAYLTAFQRRWLLRSERHPRTMDRERIRWALAQEEKANQPQKVHWDHGKRPLVLGKRPPITRLPITGLAKAPPMCPPLPPCWKPSDWEPMHFHDLYDDPPT